jgi:ligand-binding sensor protein
MQYLRNLNEEILLNRTLERRNEELLKLLEAWQTKSQKKKPKFIRSINMHEVENLMIRYYQVYKVPISLYDEEGKLLFSIGWKNICSKNHNINHQNLNKCAESMVQINNRMADVNSYIFKCTNRTNSIAIPITVENDSLGTLIVNQFLYEDEALDHAAMQRFAYENGLDFEEYKKAIDSLPVLSHEEVEKITEYYILFSEMIAFIASHNVQLQEHQNLTKEKNEIYNMFKEKLDEQSFIIKSVYQFLLQQNQELESLRNELSSLRKKAKVEFKEKSLVEESQPG